MASDVHLNDPYVWRSVVSYQHRKDNPDYTFDKRDSVPAFLDEWDDKIHYDIRGPYPDETAAKVQGGRDATARAKDTAWAPGNQRITMYRVLSVEVERSPLTWTRVATREKSGWKASSPDSATHRRSAPSRVAPLSNSDSEVSGPR